jgi:hypothetical protein
VQTRAGVSAECGGCFLDAHTCQTTTCEGSCGNPAGYNCRTCLDTSCAPALATCTGATIPAAACTMTEAQRLRGVAAALRDCTRGCADDACVIACVDTSASPTIVSAECSSCYVDMHACAASQCESECVLSPDATACDACVCANCEEELVSCAGYRTGLCP